MHSIPPKVHWLPWTTMIQIFYTLYYSIKNSSHYEICLEWMCLEWNVENKNQNQWTNANNGGPGWHLPAFFPLLCTGVSLRCLEVIHKFQFKIQAAVSVSLTSKLKSWKSGIEPDSGILSSSPIGVPSLESLYYPSNFTLFAVKKSTALLQNSTYTS